MANTQINVNGNILDGSVETPERLFRDFWVVGDDNVVSVDPAGRVKKLTEEAKAECEKRIMAVADSNTQMSMVVDKAVGAMSAEDEVVLGKANQWIKDMKAAVATIVEGDDGFEKYVERVVKNASSWPAVSDEIKALTEKY